jgi:hypothetical protein
MSIVGVFPGGGPSDLLRKTVAMVLAWWGIRFRHLPCPELVLRFYGRLAQQLLSQEAAKKEQRLEKTTGGRGGTDRGFFQLVMSFGKWQAVVVAKIGLDIEPAVQSYA